MLITPFLFVAVINLSQASSDLDDVYRSKSSDDYVPCEKGWYYFRNKCYRVSARNRHMVSWTTALDICKGYGGDLVSIQSQEEQDFVVAYLQLSVKWFAWIGLTDSDKEGDFKWSDGSVFNFSNWKIYEPSGHGREDFSRADDEDCVHMFFDTTDDILGKWNDRHCDVPENVFCEKKANHRKKSPNLMYCSPEEGGGWKYENSCFHIIPEMKTWQNAETHCKNNYNGHLLTIRDTLQDFFLELALPDIKKEIWIGIKTKDQFQQKWTSGWYVSYERFNKEERYVEGTCVARKNRKEWMTIPCTRQLPFICEVSKDSPPVLEPAPVGAHCPKDLDDWRDIGGDYCYHIEVNFANFYDANFDCQSRGGQLLSLHSQEETNILKPFMQYKIRNPVHSNAFYIGLIRVKANHEETFGWTDGSEFSYQNWQHNEPNSLQEKCGEIVTTSMKWNDLKCDTKLPGYVCSVKKIIPSRRNTGLCDVPENCTSFCVAPYSYLYGLLSECPDAKEIS